MIASNQVLSIGCFVVVSVGMNVVGRGLDPSRTLLEYILLLFAGVAIGLLVGFAVVPHLEPGRTDERVRRARDATAELLRRTAQVVPPTVGPTPQTAIPNALTQPLYRMRTSVANLGSPLDRKDDQAGASADDCASLATQLETLAIVGVLEAGGGRLTAPTLSTAADALVALPADPESGATAEADADAADFVRLARWVGRSSTELLAAYAVLTQPRS